VFDLGFALGPRINAAGRLDDMTVGIRCLLEPHVDQASHLAKWLNEMNQHRKELETQVKEEAWFDLSDFHSDQKTISLYQPEWHAGVVGIVAGRIKEQLHRPCMVFAKDSHGKLKGSGRSIEGVHLRDILDMMSKKDPDLMLAFGGHAMAAGVSLYEEAFGRFRELFEWAVDTTADSVLFEPTLMVDGGLNQSSCSLDFVRWLEDHVWGQGFAVPVFMDQFEVVNQRLLQNKHLKLTLKSVSEQEVWSAIWFGQADLLDEKQSYSLAYQPQINRYQGQENLQLNVICSLT
jgi:single-stranded-DNA-specific exonuclease